MPLTLLAELAVGRIMRAKKLSSGTRLCWYCVAADAVLVTRGRAGGGPKVADGLRDDGGATEARNCESEGRADEAALMLEARRLLGGRGWWASGVVESEYLAAEEAVWAVRCEGRLIGRVGDLGRGFIKPVEERTPIGVVCEVVNEGGMAGGLEDEDGPHGCRWSEGVLLDLKCERLLCGVS
jgi:hypothetical protein